MSALAPALLIRSSAALLVAAALVTAAEARPDLRQMTCQQAQQTLARNGAVVFTTGRNTYDRFVTSRAYCDSWEEAVPAYQQTRDTNQCQVGFRCSEPLFERNRLHRMFDD
ncbi:hypothetical protein GWI72_04560 [Microvirga tunisiensis]|uniref:Uncharacterized protein n=2 Tax=Pannonibacter tanglangensis TaxID=2750084 RepID=A0ABW9ZGB9_9HYPH|nr:MULTISPECIES: hypothetical protein [unclassified Pannonibacter]NBN63897.1 hypothetical protein [Pannonibacter sp. XCT-34]NBN77536.1 hypothetical protein [Pannonibacter sp. XCT-53]